MLTWEHLYPKDEIPDLAIFCHRLGPVHAEQMSEIAKNTLRPYNLIVHHGPGTAHSNMNAAIRRCRSRYMVIMDDDVVPMIEGWLDILIDHLKKHDEIALITPVEVKDLFKKRNCLNRIPDGKLFETSWTPGYIMAIDRAKVPTIRADELIPGPSGMSDLDLSMQVRAAGYVPAMTSEFCVYHPDKPASKSWREKFQIVASEDLAPLHVQQVDYMRRKWGDLFEEFRLMRQIREFV